MANQSTNGNDRRRGNVNSAKRLHDLLTTLSRTDGPNLYTVLPTALGFNPINSPRAVMRAYGVVERMFAEVEREVMASLMEAEEKVFYLQSLLGLTAAISPSNSVALWNDIRRQITPGDLTKLASADMTIRRYVAEQNLDEKQFEELLSSVEQALNALGELDLPNPLGDFLISQLVNIKIAVEQYRYRGIQGVQEALAGYMGGLAMVSPTLPERVSTEYKSKLLSVVTSGNAIITLARGAAWIWPHAVTLGHQALQLLIP